MRILFICKKRIESYGGISFGLSNSATFVCNALNKKGIECKRVSVIDNNSIDKEVHQYKPTHVIIEAYWVVPSKFDVLCPLHPTVKWIVRGHSKIPFFANEGICTGWTGEYIQRAEQYDNFYLSFNDLDTCNTIFYGFKYMPIYLPNIYCPIKDKKDKKDKMLKGDYVDVGCFGAIRPMKNTLQQAFASICFADRIGKKLRFHINGNRTEQKGENVVNNLRNLFKDSPHELVEHSWMNHTDFIELIRTMDIGIQVSLSESFNIVGADFVSNGVPFIGMSDMRWLSSLYIAKPTEIEDIVSKMLFAWEVRGLKIHYINKFLLHLHNVKAIQAWIDCLP